MSTQNKSVILFDGICNLCNASVNLILKKDVKNHFLFASLQSDVAKKLLLQFDSKINENNLNSIVLIKDNKIYFKSSAALIIGKELKFPYNLSYSFMIIPKFIRDFIYDVIAKNRYTWFGTKNICRIPTKEEINKFL